MLALIKADGNTNERKIGLIWDWPRGLYYKTFYGRNLRIFVIS
jgi:hypothetical protein